MSRISQIDFLRGMAVLLVLFRHHAFFAPIQRIGWVGVDLFFVLSGFLVTSLIYAEYVRYNSFSAKNFLIRRAFKIYPLFYLFLFVSILFTYFAFLLFGYSKGAWIQKILAESFFVQNYFEGLWGHTWSLAVEEHFYLFIALFLYLIVRYFPRQVNYLHFYFLLFIVTILILRILNNVNHHQVVDFRNSVYPTHLRVDSLLWGSLLAYLIHFKKEMMDGLIKAVSPKMLFVIGSVVLFFTLKFELLSQFMVTIGFTLLYISFGLILISVLYIPEKNHKIFSVVASTWLYKGVVRIGVFSYSIYLFHMFLPAIFDNVSFFNQIDFRVRFFIYLGCSIAVGVVLTKLIEIPVLKFRDKVFPRKTLMLKDI